MPAGVWKREFDANEAASKSSISIGAKKTFTWSSLCLDGQHVQLEIYRHASGSLCST